MAKCVYCQTSEAEPGYERCEPCLVKDMQPEVRWLYEQNKNTLVGVRAAMTWLNSVDDRLMRAEKHIGLIA